jgi:hypothetical protein
MSLQGLTRSGLYVFGSLSAFIADAVITVRTSAQMSLLM